LYAYRVGEVEKVKNLPYRSLTLDPKRSRIMSSKNNAQPGNHTVHHVSTYRQGHSFNYRGVLHYWPILLFVLLSALTQTVGRFI